MTYGSSTHGSDLFGTESTSIKSKTLSAVQTVSDTLSKRTKLRDFSETLSSVTLETAKVTKSFASTTTTVSSVFEEKLAGVVYSGITYGSEAYGGTAGTADAVLTEVASTSTGLGKGVFLPAFTENLSVSEKLEAVSIVHLTEVIAQSETFSRINTLTRILTEKLQLQKK